MSIPVLHGAEYSVYTRIARLALLAKGVAHRLEITDVFAEGADKSRHPFGKIPVLEHAGFRLYEACAIARYVDEAFPGPALQPIDVKQRALMTQFVSVLDSYAFKPLVLDIYVQRVLRPVADEKIIAAALPKAERVLDTLESAAKSQGFGAKNTLDALHFVPMLAYFRLAAEGMAALAARPHLAEWWDRMAENPAVRATRFPAETGLSR